MAIIDAVSSSNGSSTRGATNQGFSSESIETSGDNLAFSCSSLVSVVSFRAGMTVLDAVSACKCSISSLWARIDGFTSEGIVASRYNLAFNGSFFISVGTSGAGVASGNIQSTLNVIVGSSRAGVVGVTSERIVTGGDDVTVS